MKLKVLIQPNAKTNQVVVVHGDAVKIRIKAPPVDGEANDVLIRYLSELIGVPRKNIQILRGQTAKNKLGEIITELSTDEIRNKLVLPEKSGG